MDPSPSLDGEDTMRRNLGRARPQMLLYQGDQGTEYKVRGREYGVGWPVKE